MLAVKSLATVQKNHLRLQKNHLRLQKEITCDYLLLTLLAIDLKML